MAAEEYKIGLSVDTKQGQAALAGLNKSLGDLNRTAATTGTAVKKTGMDFTNLSRVVQDLPYGFNAISNNLTQLIPSVGALGLAFSAVVSAVTFAQIGFSAWSRKASEAKQKNDEFKDSLRDAERGALATGIQLQNFVRIAQDGNRPIAERNIALKEANKILGDHSEKLTLANINTDKATQSVQLYTQALVNEAIAAKMADKAADLLIKQRELAQQYGKDLERFNRAQQQFINRPNLSVRDQEMGRGNVYIMERDKTLKQLKETTEAYKQTTSELNQVMYTANVTGEKATKNFAALPPPIKATKAEVEKLTIAWNRLNQEGAKPVSFGLEKESQSLQLLRAEFESINKAQAQPGFAVGQFLAADARARVAAMDAEKAALARMKEEMQQTQAAAMALKMQLLETAFDGFTNLINVATSAEASFDNIKKALFDMIKQLAIAAAKALLFRAILGTASGGIGFAAGGAGIGGIFGKIFGKVPMMAAGGIVTGPTMAMIGEGNEAEAVLPLSQLDALLSNSGGNMPYVLSTSIRGSDLQLVMRRADQQGRFTGNTF